MHAIVLVDDATVSIREAEVTRVRFAPEVLTWIILIAIH